jgi:hypothetical protein
MVRRQAKRDRGEEDKGLMDEVRDAIFDEGGGAEKGPAEETKGKLGGRQVQTFVVSFGSDLLSEPRVDRGHSGLKDGATVFRIPGPTAHVPLPCSRSVPHTR